jgi:hypothetical protein
VFTFRKHLYSAQCTTNRPISPHTDSVNYVLELYRTDSYCTQCTTHRPISPQTDSVNYVLELYRTDSYSTQCTTHRPISPRTDSVNYECLDHVLDNPGFNPCQWQDMLSSPGTTHLTTQRLMKDLPLISNSWSMQLTILFYTVPSLRSGFHTRLSVSRYLLTHHFTHKCHISMQTYQEQKQI